MQSLKAWTRKFSHKKFLSFGSMCGGEREEKLFDNGLDESASCPEAQMASGKLNKWDESSLP